VCPFIARAIKPLTSGTGTAEAWLVSFTRQLRTVLPQGKWWRDSLLVLVNTIHTGDYIITHAPVAPWFSPGKFPGGGYLNIDRTVGSLIDWYNIQFYNRKHKRPLHLTATTLNSRSCRGCQRVHHL